MTYSQINPTKVGGFLLLTILILIVGCSTQDEIKEKQMCTFTIEQHYGDSIIYGNQSFYIDQHPKLVIYFKGYEENMYWFDKEVKLFYER